MELDKIVWKLVSQHIKGGINIRLNDVEDIYQQCYEVALQAILNYKNSKNVKLSTFIYVCIENYLKDVYKYSDFRKNEHYDLEEVTEDSYYIDDFTMTMQSILNKDQFDVFTLYFIENWSFREIAKVKNMNLAGVHRCFRSICQQYQSHVLNPMQAMIS